MEQKIGNSNLPISWAVCNLDDILLKISNGANVTQYNEKVGYPISRIETIWNQGIDLDRVKYIKENDADFVEKYSLQFGDILLSHINSDAHLGKTGVFKNQVKTLIHGINILLIRPVSNINSDFINFQFNHLRTKGGFVDIAQRSVNQSSVNQRKLKSLQIIIPPLAEQHRIVVKIDELFSELDKGIENLKTAQTQLKVYRQALLKHAFEGKLTTQWREQNKDKLKSAAALNQSIQTERAARYQQQLADWQAAGQEGSKPKAPKALPPLTIEELGELPELPKSWAWVKVGEISKVGTGITPLKSRSDFYANGNIPWVTSGALNNNFVTEASDYVTELALKVTNLHIYPHHTLLIALYGEGKTRGKCSELLIEATTNQAIAAIVLDGTSEKLRKYMKWFFQKNYGDIRLKSSGGVQPNLNLGIIENTLFPMCSLEEANHIVDSIESKLSEIEQLDQIITTALQQSESLRQSILKKAFSGDLVPQEANDEPASVLLERIKAERNKSNNLKSEKKWLKVKWD